MARWLFVSLSLSLPLLLFLSYSHLTGAAGDRARPAWRCAVLDPWQVAYSKHPLQRERTQEEQSSGAGGWWTDSRHLHPGGDLMKAIVQMLAAILVG
jgi:hypothetical protein